MQWAGLPLHVVLLITLVCPGLTSTGDALVSQGAAQNSSTMSFCITFAFLTQLHLYLVVRSVFSNYFLVRHVDPWDRKLEVWGVLIRFPCWAILIKGSPLLQVSGQFQCCCWTESKTQSGAEDGVCVCTLTAGWETETSCGCLFLSDSLVVPLACWA